MSLAEDAPRLHRRYAPAEADLEQWDLDALRREVEETFAIDTSSIEFGGKTAVGRDPRRTVGAAPGVPTSKEQIVGREILQRVERDIMLQVVDQQWKDHPTASITSKEGIGLRGYMASAIRSSSIKKESFEMFQAMKDRVDQETVSYLWRLRPVLTEEAAPAPPPVRQVPPRQPLIMNNPSEQTSASARRQGIFDSAPSPRLHRRLPAPPFTGRRSLLVGGDDAEVKTAERWPESRPQRSGPCGSGKKYKKRHGAAA